MNVPKLLVLASLMSLALITGTAVTNMPPALYAQSNNATNTNATNTNATNTNATNTNATNTNATNTKGAHFIAVLNGDNVFPPVKTNATGKAELTLLGDRNTMSYKVTGGPVDEVKDVTISHTTGGRAADIVVLRSATQTGLSGQMKSATLAGNFTSSDFIRGPKDMAALVNDILSGNVILRVDTLKFPLGIVAGELKPNL
jgi:CHRD domain